MKSVRIYTYVGFPPHTFLGITDDNCNTIYRGFAPIKTGLYGDGVVKDEIGENNKLHQYNIRTKAIPLTDEQYTRLMLFIDKTSKNPHKYNLIFGSQCTIWAMNALQEAGVIDQEVIPDYELSDKLWGLGYLGGFLSTAIIYNPYTQFGGFKLYDWIDEEPDSEICKLVKMEISNPIVIENEGKIIFNIMLSEPLNEDLKLKVNTNDNTTGGEAVVLQDYIGINKSIIIPAGTKQFPVEIDIINDEIAEKIQEKLSLHVIIDYHQAEKYGLEHIYYAVGTIVDDDNLSISIEDAICYETDKKIEFTINLNRALKEDLTLKLSTIDGTAIGDKDFRKIEDKVITIKAGNRSQKFTIEVAQDDIYEIFEEFMLIAKYEDGSYKGDDLKEVKNSLITATGEIIDFPKENCPTPTTPNFSLRFPIPSTPLYYTPSKGGGYGGGGGGYGGGGYGGGGAGSSGVGVYTKEPLPYTPYIECINTPELNFALSIKDINLNQADNTNKKATYQTRDSLSLTDNSSSNSLLNSLNSTTSNKLFNQISNHSQETQKLYFDMNNDGFKERMLTWFDKNEAILINDINKNAIVDSGAEIIGNNYINSYGEKTIDILATLEEFDTNKDGIIDQRDTHNLALWIDKNSNAKTDKGELIYLKDTSSPLKNISLSKLDKLLSGYDRNSDLKIDKNDEIYNHIFLKENSDNTINLYIYGDESAKAFLGEKRDSYILQTSQGAKVVKDIIFYDKELSLNKELSSLNSNNNELIGNNYDNSIKGNSGSDILQGFGGRDELYGMNGDDYIYGGDGNDIIVGGKGNDYLDGGGWDDTYIYNEFDGKDIINDTHGNNTLIINHLSKHRTRFIQQDNSLILYFDEDNQILIRDYFINKNIKEIKFQTENNTQIVTQDMINSYAQDYESINITKEYSKEFYNRIQIIGDKIIDKIVDNKIILKDEVKDKIKILSRDNDDGVSYTILYLDKQNKVFIDNYIESYDNNKSPFKYEYANKDMIYIDEISVSTSKEIDYDIFNMYLEGYENIATFSLDIGDGVKHIYEDRASPILYRLCTLNFGKSITMDMVRVATFNDGRSILIALNDKDYIIIPTEYTEYINFEFENKDKLVIHRFNLEHILEDTTVKTANEILKNINNQSTIKDIYSANSLDRYNMKNYWLHLAADANSLVQKEHKTINLIKDNFTQPKIDEKHYIDDIKSLSQTDINEIKIQSGYIGTSAKVGVNNGKAAFKYRWFKSDNLDSIYKEDISSQEDNIVDLSGSGIVRDINDAMSDDKNLKQSVDDFVQNTIDKEFDDLNLDMDNILKQWALNDEFGSTNLYIPPIVLDLNANGTTSTNLQNSEAYFNYKNDGRRSKTGWIENGDGLLCIDINNDGVINNSSELFGTGFKLKSGKYAKDGHEALSEFDTNKDGKIDNNDEEFNKLKIWKDNGDAKSQNREIFTLSELGISSLSLQISDNIINENGNKITASGTFIKDNKEGIMRDVWFEVSKKQSIANSNLSDSDEKKIAIVEAFRGVKLTEEQRENPYIILGILKEYENIKLDSIIKFLSNELFGKDTKSCQLIYQALNLKLEKIIQNKATSKESALTINLVSTALKRDYNYAIFKLNNSYLKNAKIQKLLLKSGINFWIEDKQIYGEIGNYHFANKNNQSYDFSSKKSGISLKARGGNDIIIGSNFNDEIDGGSGDDTIFSGKGIDIIRARGGNDIIIGSNEINIYEYYLGDGNDIIYDDGGVDIIRFAYLVVDDIAFKQDGKDLLINISSPHYNGKNIGSIKVKDGFEKGKIEKFYLGDKIYSFDEILKIKNFIPTTQIKPENNPVKFKNSLFEVVLQDIREISSTLVADNLDNDKLIFEILQNPKNGRLILNTDGSYNYEAKDKFIGSDMAKVRVSDGKGSFDEALIEFEINVSKPIIKDDKFILDEDDKLSKNLVIENKIGGNLTYEILTISSNLNTNISSSGELSIVPIPNYNGEENIILKVTNEYGLSTTKELKITINSINDSPSIDKPNEIIELKNIFVYSSNIKASDVDDDILTYKVLNPNPNFILKENGDYIYKSTQNLDETFNIEVSDSKGAMSFKTITFKNLGYVNDGTKSIVIDGKDSELLTLENLKLSDVKFNKNGNDLIISNLTTIKDYFISKDIKLNKIKLADKTIDISNTTTPIKKWWQLKATAKLTAKGTIFSSNGYENLKGSNHSDTIISFGRFNNIKAGGGDDLIFVGQNDNANGGSGNDKFIVNSDNSILCGDNGDDIYEISSSIDNTIIKDKEFINAYDGGKDVLRIRGRLDKSEITFFKGGIFNKDLIIKYQGKTTQILNQSNTKSAVEKIELDNGDFISSFQINKIIEELNSYANNNGISTISNDTINNNTNLMQIVMNGWNC